MAASDSHRDGRQVSGGNMTSRAENNGLEKAEKKRRKGKEEERGQRKRNIRRG